MRGAAGSPDPDRCEHEPEALSYPETVHSSAFHMSWVA